jgi:hypothetical protein
MPTGSCIYCKLAVLNNRYRHGSKPPSTHRIGSDWLLQHRLLLQKSRNHRNLFWSRRQGFTHAQDPERKFISPTAGLKFVIKVINKGRSITHQGCIPRRGPAGSARVVRGDGMSSGDTLWKKARLSCKNGPSARALQLGIGATPSFWSTSSDNFGGSATTF